MAEARLAELVAALSLGIDLGFGQPMEHVLRQCLISLRLAEQLGLDESERADVYYTALLINVGCHSDAHEQAKWFGDDFASKAIKYDHEPRSLRMMATGLSFLGHGHPPLHRFRLGLEFALSGRREVDGMIESHSQIARALGEQLGLSEAVLEALAASYERWDGRGWPGDLRGEQVPLPSRISQFAEYVEVANRVDGVGGRDPHGAPAARQAVRPAGRRRTDARCGRDPAASRTMHRAGARWSTRSPGSRSCSTTSGSIARSRRSRASST